MAILAEFNVSCNVEAGQLSDRGPLYVYHITLQASLRISIRTPLTVDPPYTPLSINLGDAEVNCPPPLSTQICARPLLSTQGRLQSEGA